MLTWVTKALAVWQAVKAIFSIGATLMKWVYRQMIEKAIKQRQEEIDKAAERIKKAQEIKDDEARLNEKAAAMCEMEKLSDPDSDCDR